MRFITYRGRQCELRVTLDYVRKTFRVALFHAKSQSPPHTHAYIPQVPDPPPSPGCTAPDVSLCDSSGSRQNSQHKTHLLTFATRLRFRDLLGNEAEKSKWEKRYFCRKFRLGFSGSEPGFVSGEGTTIGVMR